jgi:hypothetical protein
MAGAALKEAKEATPTRRKISVRQVKLSDMDVGFSFKGKYCGTVVGKPFKVINEKTGEITEKTISSVIFETNGERTAYVADQGLLGALNDSMVKEGDHLEVVKLEKVKLTKGRTMNAYDIFALEA